MIELIGNNVILQTLEREHCRQLWLEYEPQTPVTTEPLNPGLSIEGADEWFEEIQKTQGKTHLHLGIFLKNGELIGDIQLTHIDWRNRSANLGIGISKSEYRGRGYGTDACKTFIKYALDEMDLYRLSARTLVHNTAARHVLENAGFTLEGSERQAVTITGRRWDRLLFGLLRIDLDYV